MNLSKKIEQAMNCALDYLAQTLRCTVYSDPPDTHTAIIITGWNDDDETRHAIACYLVGLRGGAIDAALKIRAQLEDTPQDKIELYQNVIKIVGEDNAKLTQDQKEDERNPWIAEAIWHLCLAIASRIVDWHPPGQILALDYAHVIAKDHGLDVAALYESGETLGMSIVETKAYKADPNKAIQKAVAFFKDVDLDLHGARIRQSVQFMRTALTPEQQSRVTGSFWKRTRSYLPNPHYDSNCEMDWTNSRPSFRELEPPKSNIIVMPHGISNFDSFFDKISDEMRKYAKELANV
jgi:hypothetical protein